MKQQVIRFYQDKDDQIPDDSYPLEWESNSIGWVIHNWLEMYPNGKVDFVSIDISKRNQ